MKKVIKRVLVIVGVLILVFLFAGLLLPRHVRVERSTVIDAPQQAVFELLNGFERFNEWSPWFGRDPETEYAFEGPKTGVGAVMTWTSQHREVGKGKQEILETESPRSVRIAFDFGKQGTAVADFMLRPDVAGTHVTWLFDADLGNNPLARYFGLVLDEMIGPACEKGLANLKKVAEAGPPAAPPVELALKEVDAQRVLYISGEIQHSPENVSRALGERYGKLMAFMNDNGIEPAGLPLAITTEWGDGRWAFRAALPIPAGAHVEETDEVKVGETYGGKVVQAVHRGPHEELTPTYERVMAYMKKESLAENGNSWEQYVNDPVETEPEDLLTNIYFPVKQ